MENKKLLVLKWPAQCLRTSECWQLCVQVKVGREGWKEVSGKPEALQEWDSW